MIKRDSIHLLIPFFFVFLGHFMVLRDESRRLVQVPDLVTLDLPDEGPTPCPALILILRNGEANPDDKVEYMGAIRNKDVLLCPLSSLGFYFFWRWGHVTTGATAQQPVQPRRRLPSFYQPSDYYDLRALPGDIKHPEREWAYEGQRDWTDRLFMGAGIQSSRKTHATRKKAARHAEVGEEEGQIRRVGRWTNDAMSRVYLTSLPRKFMRKMAGFPEEAGSFSLPRAEMEPPPELTRQIWPEVDEWLAKMEAFRPGSRHNQVQQMDLAGSGFLQLLRILRTVVLQDSIVLRPLFPDHPVWKADVFTSDAYQAFAARVTAASEAAEEPEDLVPALLHKMDMMRAEMNQGFAAIQQSVDVIHRELREAKAAIHDFCSGERSFTVCAADHGDPPSPPPGPPSHLANPDPDPDAPAARLNPSLEPIRYRFDRTVTTVTGLWEEWTVGRGSGPSVEQLDSAWGPRWRDQTERQFYSRRLPIIKAIQGRHASGIASSLQEAAVQVEGLRTEQHGGMSLNKFGKALKEAAGLGDGSG